jgi:diguanylate cyclase (GGDEF)-like protein
MQFVIWNPSLKRLLGHPPNTMLNRVWTSRGMGYCDQYGKTLPEQDCSVHLAAALGKSTTSQVRMRRADGKLIEIELQTVPLLDQNGRLQGTAEIFRDLTRHEHKPEEIRQLKLAARRDPLTSVANRAEMESQLTAVLQEYSEQPDTKPLAMMFADIDFFKQINDSYGHAIGDKVLIEIARLLQQETYSGELVSRYGGEEFVILCPDTDLEQAVQRAERLRLQISACVIDDTKDLQITMSFGVTVAEPGDTKESLLRRADTALYLAKDAGRNKTCSLTSDDVLSLESNPKHDCMARSEPDCMLLTSTFQAFVAADMIVYKLGGFVHDEGGRLVEVTPKRAVIRMGDRGLLPIWGNADTRQPVEIEVTFGDDPAPNTRNGKGVSPRVQVGVRIRPIGWVRDAKIFDRRAKRVLKTLRSFFAAN